MEDILGLSRPKATGDAERIKTLIRQHMKIDGEATLMVSELRCHEDGCPDIETVIALMTGADQRQSWKIAKPMAQIDEGDVLLLL